MSKGNCFTNIDLVYGLYVDIQEFYFYTKFFCMLFAEKSTFFKLKIFLIPWIRILKLITKQKNLKV